MKLSTKTRYGLRAMLDLAIYGNGETPVPISEISRRQDLSESYLEQLLARLRRVGLVESVRGSRGGYMLGRPAVEITAADIMEALDGPIQLSECAGGVGCDNSTCCPGSVLWSRLKKSMDGVMRGTNLKELIEEYSVEHLKEEENDE